MPSGELVAKKLDAFVLADLLKPKLRSERIFQEPQRRLLQPGKKDRARQEHARRALCGGGPRELENLPDLLLGELVHVVKDEERRRWLRGF